MATQKKRPAKEKQEAIVEEVKNEEIASNVAIEAPVEDTVKVQEIVVVKDKQYTLPVKVKPKNGVGVRCADGLFIPGNGTVVYTKEELYKLLPFQQYITIQ
nr:MAG TPA: hypothetical protein [Caudoviricetes sp.]